MVYTPPTYDAVDHAITSGYTPPTSNSVDFAIGASNTPARSYFTQTYSLAVTARSYLEQTWTERIRSYFIQYYGDADTVRSSLEQNYWDAGEVRSYLVQNYSDAYIVRSSLEQEYDFFGSVRSDLVQYYSITGTAIRSYLNQTYNIEDFISVRSSLEQTYALIDGTSTIVVTDPATDPILVVTNPDTTNPAGVTQPGAVHEGIEYLSINIKAAMGQYCISCDITLATRADYERCPYLSDIVFTLGGTEYTFFVDSHSRTMTNKGVTHSIQLLSPTAKLDAPHSATIVDNLLDGIYASELVTQMADLQGITVDYQVIDWFLPGHVISISDETPLSVIKKVVNAIGAIVQTKPNGDLLIISDYPEAVPDWATASVVQTLDVGPDILSFTASSDVREGFNAFMITDQGSSTESITLEEVDIDGLHKEIRGFRVPFADGSFPLETSGNPGITIEPFVSYFEEQVPNPDDPDAEEWEVIEFIDWQGTTSKPIYAVVDYDWIEDDLGAVPTFQISEDGTLVVINQSSVPSESLLRIKYTTRYWKWEVSGPTDRPVQFYVPEIEVI